MRVQTGTTGMTSTYHLNQRPVHAFRLGPRWFVGALGWAIFAVSGHCWAQELEALGSEPAEQAAVPNAVQAASFPSITAATAIVIDRDTGAVLGDKNADTRRPNPSTTKIMT